MRNIYESYKTPYVGMWQFWRPALIINSPDIARNVLIKDSANFRDRFMSSGPTDKIGYYNILFAKVKYSFRIDHIYDKRWKRILNSNYQINIFD